MSFVEDKNKIVWGGVVIIIILSMIFILILPVLLGEEQKESAPSGTRIDNSSFFSVYKPNYTPIYFTRIYDNYTRVVEIRALNGSDYSNSTITINMSYIQETRQNNGSLIIEIRKDVTTSFIESPQKRLIVGDVVETTHEFYMWKGDTTSFTAYVVNVSNDGIVYLKIKDGSWTGQDGNNFSLNEYWVQKTGHVNESEYNGWYWP